MGMTIDKAIAKIWHCIVSIRDCTGNKEFVEALELSINTMRKYQKIEQILKDIPYGGEATVRRIQEVIEDGNDNSIMDNSNL